MKHILIILTVFAITGCSVVSHYTASYGKRMDKGAIVEGRSFKYKIQDSHIRAHVDNDGMVAYEDFGPGMSRGRVFVVRLGPINKQSDMITDLRQFGASPAQALSSGRLVATRVRNWRNSEVEFHLIEVPAVIGRSGGVWKVTERERVWVLGMIISSETKRYWISLTSSDSFFNEIERIEGRNLDEFIKFADGFSIDDKK